MLLIWYVSHCGREVTDRLGNQVGAKTEGKVGEWLHRVVNGVKIDRVTVSVNDVARKLLVHVDKRARVNGAGDGKCHENIWIEKLVRRDEGVGQHNDADSD